MNQYCIVFPAIISFAFKNNNNFAFMPLWCLMYAINVIRDPLIRHWPIISRLPINTKSCENLTFLTFEIEKKLLTITPALRVTVKPALGNHLFVKLKVEAGNRWSLNEVTFEVKCRSLGQVLSLLCVCD